MLFIKQIKYMLTGSTSFSSDHQWRRNTEFAHHSQCERQNMWSFQDVYISGFDRELAFVMSKVGRKASDDWNVGCLSSKLFLSNL